MSDKRGRYLLRVPAGRVVLKVMTIEHGSWAISVIESISVDTPGAPG
jgi:hypothetical protein